MNLNDKFLDDISYDQAIFTNTSIYRKMKNLKDNYDIYVLTRLDNRFVWSKTNNYHINSNAFTEDFNDLRFATENLNNDKYLTIYRLYEGTAIDFMIYKVNWIFISVKFYYFFSFIKTSIITYYKLLIKIKFC